MKNEEGLCNPDFVGILSKRKVVVIQITHPDRPRLQATLLLFLSSPIKVLSRLCFSFFILQSSACFGQNQAALVDEGLGTWNIVNVRMDLNRRWSLSTEAQIRSLRFYDNFHYYEVKGGAGYRISDQASVFLGVGTYQTYGEGGTFVRPKVNDELRIWPQLALSNRIGRLRIEHRYRFENRFTSQGFLLRFRQRIQAQLPLNNPDIRPGTLAAVVWNELFLTDREPFFQRNRFFVGAYYEFTPRYAMQLGWVNQYDYSVEDETGKNFMQISALFSLRRRKTDQAPMPTSDE
jgi:hypothetical protein